MKQNLLDIINQTLEYDATLPSFQSLDLMGRELPLLTDDEALDLIGNLTIDIQETYIMEDDFTFKDFKIEALFQQLTRTYLYHRPLMPKP